MSLPLCEEKPHRKANTCQGVYKELIACLQRSKCMREMGYSLRHCLDNSEPKHIGLDCHLLRIAMRDCKNMLLNPTLRFQGNKYGGSW